MRHIHVSLDEAARRVDEQLAKARTRRRMEDARARLDLRGGYIGFFSRWGWSVVDLTTGATVASGRALTEWGMRRRRYAAYLLVLDALASDGRVS